MRAAVTEWYAETLRRPNRDVSAPLPWRYQHGEGKEIGRGDHQGTALLELLGSSRPIDDRTGRPWIVEHDPEGDRRVGFIVEGSQIYPDRFGSCLHYRAGRRVGVSVDKENLPVILGEPPRHRHRLGGGCRLVEEGSVGDLQPGQVGDHGLEVEQSLQPPL